jgi:hypothetical protein
MEKSLTEPLIEPVLAVLEHEEQEYSEWRILYTRHPYFVDTEYQNRDFRNSDGTPVVDPETYRILQEEIYAIGGRSSRRQNILFMVLYVPFLLFAPRIDAPSGNGVIFVVLALMTLYHVLCDHFIFKKVDIELLEIVRSYETRFCEEYGVTLGHAKCSPGHYRWFKDDSGIYLRRPRTAVIPVSSQGRDEPCEEFPPIYIRGLSSPGNVHIHEPSYDASMKVDSNTWALLQSTHQEIIQHSAGCKVVSWILLLAFISLVTYSFCNLQSTLVLFWFGGISVVLLLCFIAILIAEDKRFQRMFHMVAEQVNTSLQKDPNTAHLTLKVYDLDQLANRRYQFERLIVDPMEDIP